MEKILFSPGNWEEKLTLCYSHRFSETPAPHQAPDHIYSDKNETHREGFDNLTLLTKEKYAPGATATITCGFENLGCPEIILVPEAESCPDGAVRYGACFETVLYQDGINVWRHFREAGRCFWHKRLGLSAQVAHGEKHILQVRVHPQALEITLDGNTTWLHTEDLPEAFHFGITLCEGIARVYDFTVK